MVCLGFGGVVCLSAQDPFPDPIPKSTVSVHVDAVATVPDSASNQPPRITVLTQDPGGRLFVSDQRGPLHTFVEGGPVVEFLDLRDFPALALTTGNEPGLQSFAFHPEFLVPAAPGFGRFYTIHSSGDTAPAPDFDPGGGTSFHTVLLEWRTSTPGADVFAPADPAHPYRELLRLKQPYSNHNAGLIAFNPVAAPGGPDFGNLYIAIGDGGSGGDPLELAEDPANPFGAILRIDPLGSNGINGAYGIVADNALAADGDPGTLGEIYCYGLRNPQRFGWDIVTGNCFIADIGQNVVEEINLAANGAHFGWDLREGSFDFEGGNTAGLTDPVAEYDHTGVVDDLPGGISGGRAVTTGEVARGTCVPGLDGLLLLADFPTGLAFVLDVDSDPLDGGQDGLAELVLLDENGDPRRFIELVNAARAARGLGASSRADLRFSVNTPGRVYLTSKHDGIIRRIRPTVPPGIAIENLPGSQIEVSHEGILQTSTDLTEWTDVMPQPLSPAVVVPDGPARFWRGICR